VDVVSSWLIPVRLGAGASADAPDDDTALPPRLQAPGPSEPAHLKNVGLIRDSAHRRRRQEFGGGLPRGLEPRRTPVGDRQPRRHQPRVPRGRQRPGGPGAQQGDARTDRGGVPEVPPPGPLPNLSQIRGSGLATRGAQPRVLTPGAVRGLSRPTRPSMRLRHARYLGRLFDGVGA
jgi:hypothetical protein